ncbi:MAG: glycosyltransferase [Chloroflexota bacterium]
MSAVGRYYASASSRAERMPAVRILFVTPRFPYPPLKGDTLRTYHQIRALSRDHQITLLSMADAPVSREDYDHVARFCSHVEVVRLPRWRAALNLGTGVLSDRPLQVSYYHSPIFQQRLDETLMKGKFDAIHVTLIRMLPYFWERTDLPVVVDLIDSLALNLEARRNSVRGPRHLAYEMEYQRVLDFERSVVERFPALVVSSPADKEMLGGKNISVIPNGVDLDKFALQPQQGRDPQTLIFTGNMGYGPNEEAVLWFIAEVWPVLRSKHPRLRFQVVGTNPTDRVGEAARTAGVEVLGRVPEVTHYLGKATIAVCPMRSGSGIQNKVLEAMATGTPVVATRIANRGVGGAANHDLLVADSPADFAYEIERLLNDAQLRADLASAGRALVEQKFRWEEHANQLSIIYRTRTLGRRDYSGTPLPNKRQVDKRQGKRINVMQMTDITGRGGAEKALVDIALRLDRSRYNVTVCATRSAGNYQPVLDQAGINTFVQGRKSRWDFAQWIKLVLLLRREKVDVLHTHLFGSNTLGRLLGRLAGVPVIIAHEHWSTKARREVTIDRLLYRLSDRILVPSSASKTLVREMERIPARRIDVLYNGVDTAQFAQEYSREEVRAELGIDPGATVIGIVGRLSEEKGGVDNLIRAVGRLHVANPDLRLLIVGDGPLRSSLETVAAAGAAPGVVHFAGTRTDVARLLGAMDMFVLPSLNEALPIVLLEAMAAGLPVVATGVGGVPEIVEDGKTGLLVPPGDQQALQAAIARLLDNPLLGKQLAAAGKANIALNFTIEKMVERLESLYDSLLTRKRKGIDRTHRSGDQSNYAVGGTR